MVENYCVSEYGGKRIGCLLKNLSEEKLTQTRGSQSLALYADQSLINGKGLNLDGIEIK